MIRPAFSTWSHYQARLRETVEGLTEDQLARQPSPDRWPMWATIGHLACQRVFWLCDYAGDPGADATPFTNAGNDCPGDEDLEHVLSSEQLVAALDSTFRIVDQVLDGWTVTSLADEIRPEWDETRVHTRGFVVQRVFSHDVYHCAELNEILATAGLPLIDLWN
jgi:hypothetical protein